MADTITPYRILARPGQGLALVAEPGGRAGLWVRNVLATWPVPCSRCGAVTVWHYRPPLAFGKGTGFPHLCRACVEGDAGG